jgi:hypothetical protein
LKKHLTDQLNHRSMSEALRPASLMARASLQHPAQAQTDPNKKMNTDNINIRHLEYR